MRIISYFKVLPTDPRFQSLNIFQKILLLSVINDSEREKFDLIKIGLQKFGMIMDPTSIAAGTAHDNIQLGEGEHYNSEFERHSRSAMETGLPDISPVMKDALDKIYKIKDKNDVLRITGSVNDILKDADPGALG